MKTAIIILYDNTAAMFGAHLDGKAESGFYAHLSMVSEIVRCAIILNVHSQHM